MKRSAIVLPALFAALLLGGVLYRYVELSRHPCSNTSPSEFPSPNGKLKAVVFKRGCGAIPTYSTQVSILDRSAPFLNLSGNAFGAGPDPSASTSTPGGGPAVHVLWQSTARLLVQHEKGARVFLRETEVNGVRIEYAVLSRDGV